ncbi:MAG: tetratricopeptide repeat protein [Bacteroidota bacterium]
MYRRFWKYGVVLFLFITSFSGVHANVLDNIAARKLTIEGLQYAYDLDVANANSKFDQAIDADSTFAPAVLYRSLPLIWKLLANRNQADYDEFMKRADQIFKVAEGSLENKPGDADALFAIGMTYLYRACIHGRFDSYIKAAWDARKGYSYLEDCVEVETNFHDAYLGLGFIHYVAAMLPRPLRWMFAIIGVESDMHKGIAEIQRVTEKGIYAKTEAQFYLGMYYAYLEEEQHGVDLLNSLSTQFPGNVIFIYNLAGAELRQKHVDQARELFKKVLQYAKTDYDIMAMYSTYRLGECALRVNDFPEAKKWFSQYLQQSVAPHFRAVAFYRIGQCEEAMGNRQQALEEYGNAVAIQTKHQEDRVAIRRAQKAQLRPMSSIELILFKTDNLYYAGDYTTVVSAYQQLMKRTDLSDDEKGEIYHGLGRAYIDMNRLDDAAKILNRIFGLKFITETWIQPWARYYLAVVAAKRGDNDLAKQYLDIALDADNYDYKMWLTFRAERLKERL